MNLGALLYNGFDLASFTLSGDLAFAQGGDSDPKVPAIGKIVVDSIGAFGSATSGLFPGAVGLSFKQAPSIKIKGDARGAYFDLGTIGSLVIGGSLIGAVKIQSGGKLGAVTVKGAVAGESLASPGVGSATAPLKGADVAIGSVTIGQSAEFLQILGGYDKTRIAKNADAVISKVKVGGDFRASSLFAGVVASVDNLLGTVDDTKAAVTRDAANRFFGIASIMIRGQAIGTVDTGDVFAIESETIGKAVINGFTYKTKLGARNAQDTFGLGFASPGPGGVLSDFYLREITA